MANKKIYKEYFAEDCGEIRPLHTPNNNDDSILTALKQYIDNNKVTGLEMKEPEDALIFAPYSSFQKSPKWTVGRYIGEMVVNLPKENIKNARKDQTIRLSIHPRFGTKFLIHMIEEIYSFRILQSTKRQDKGNTWNNIYQLICDNYGSRNLQRQINMGYLVRR